MKLIKKNKPQEFHYLLEEFKKDINGTYPNLTSELKDKLLEALLKEQNFFCAYCMQKINEQSATIEHIIGQSYVDENDNKLGEQNQLNYDNLLAVCEGKSCNQELHCDKSRANYQKDRSLYANPLKDVLVKNIKFSDTGNIYYKDFIEIEKIEQLKDWKSLDEDSNIRFDLQVVLNLNCQNLKEKRKTFIEALKKFTKNWSDKERTRKKLSEYTSNTSHEFSQVAIYHLSKKIQRNNLQ